MRDETKSIKHIINEAFVASSEDIITDYNDLYCLFTVNIIHVCICDRRNDKQALLYTAQNSANNMKSYVQAVSQKLSWNCSTL